MTLCAGTASGFNDLGRPYSIKGNAGPETLGTAKYYSIVQNGIFYKFGPGRFPTIEIDIQSSDAFSINSNCTIVGNLTDS